MARAKPEKKDFRVAVGAEPADRAISAVRADLRISPQLFYGQLCFVIKDPVTLRYFRLQPIEHFLVTQFDGKKTARDLLALLHQQFPESDLTVQDVLRFVGMLHESHLLIGEGIAHAEWLSNRASVSRRRRMMEGLQSFFFAKLPLFNPDKFLTFLEKSFGRFVFSGATGLVAVGLVLLALWQVLLNTDRFAHLPYDLLSVQNLFVLYCVFVVTKVFHEFGHGWAAKHFGGEVSQMGLMLFVFTPAFYCDTSDAWMIPSRAARLWINSGGIIVELVIAAIATFVWLQTPGETLLSQIAMNTMISCSVATLFFNANPLLKYDGYYFLADLLEIPNLYTKGRQFIGYYVQKNLLGLKPTMPPDRRRLGWLVSFAVASGIYRWVVFFAIISLLYMLFDKYELGPLGVALAAGYVVLTAVVPTVKAVRFLWKQRWEVHRRVAWAGAAGAGCVGVLVLVALLPWKHTIRGALVITAEAPPPVEMRAASSSAPQPRELAGEAAIMVQTPGYIQEVLRDVGESVRQGEVIIRLSNPELEGEIQAARSRRDQALLKMQSAQAEGRSAEYRGAQDVAAAFSQQLALLEQRAKDLTLRAPFDGVVVREESLRQIVGNYIPPGQKLGKIIQLDRLGAAIVLPQSQASLVKPGMDVRIRLWSSPATVVNAKVVRISSTVSDEVMHSQLSATVKGDLAVTQNAKGEMRYTGRQSTVFVELPQGVVFLADGMTGRGEIVVQRTQVYQRVWRMILESTTPDWHL